MSRRVVLIDFDWQDADLMPQLLRRPGVSVRLVAGEDGQDAGVRVAELCGLPRTLDLADLTREIFDLALIGERSSRRTQLESLLLALGTPCQTPGEFLRGHAEAVPSMLPTIEAPLALHAAALEHSLGGVDFDALVEQALPDLGADAPVAPRPVETVSPPRVRIISLEDFPSREARARLEGALKGLVVDTGAGTAELHAGDAGSLQLVAQVGPEDKLLRGLIDLAHEMGTPQVVTRLSEPGKGRAWGAWPFKTMQRSGVLAASAIDPDQGWAQWQRMVDELRSTWDEEDREKAGAAFPFVPQRTSGWIENEEFRQCVEFACERHRRDRMRFELHRLDFPDASNAVDRLCAWLPGQLRDTDSITRPSALTVLLLVAGAADGFVHLRRRVLALWDTAWRDSGASPPAPALVDQHVELAGPEDAPVFAATAAEWLAGR
ncbi:MAG TPA: hypothetical protein VMH61_06700 [Candidatus Acidoferrales bacterium]|nr:hypothetical protein [Candidatus Acidoferrales bacterium]